MNDEWTRRVLALKRRPTEVEDAEFTSLVYQAMGRCSLADARTLMKTFAAGDDYGVQEIVATVLYTAEPEVRVRALLEHLPQLMTEARDWADSLVGAEIYGDPSPLLSIARHMDNATKRSLVRLLNEPAFAQYFPNATEIASELRLS